MLLHFAAVIAMSSIHQYPQHDFERDGFVVMPGFASPACLAVLRSLAVSQLRDAVEPLELEADLQYAGAPDSCDAPGGKTARRLLDAYGRGPAFKAWATSADIVRWLGDYFGSSPVLSLAHHNCIMTKHPDFGTATGWHQDIRYWSFSDSNLVSVWLALGTETAENGGLWFIPGSHKAAFGRDQFDDRLFFREDLDQNQPWLAQARCPTLAPGDVVFFHCRTLHSAHRNDGDAVKLSLVHTYHGAGCLPVPDTRSASRPEIRLENPL